MNIWRTGQIIEKLKTVCRYIMIRCSTEIKTRRRIFHDTAPSIIGASLSEPHCYVANRGKRNALWCVRTRNFSTVIKIPSACDRNFYQFVVNLPIVFPSSQLLRQFAWLRISQDASHFARRNLLAELVEQ